MRKLRFSETLFRPRLLLRNKLFPNQCAALKTRPQVRRKKVVLFNKIRVDLRRWWDIHVTIRELNRLDYNELSDLGIGRWQIPELAHKRAILSSHM